MIAKRRKQNKTKRRLQERKTTRHPPGRTQVRETCGYSTMASEPARACLRWAILCLVLPVTFRHATACRSPALTFTAEINSAMKRPAFCSAVLRHSPSSWAAVVHWLALMPKAVRSSRKQSIHSFSCLPTQPRRTTILRNYTLRQSRTLHARHKPREQDTPSE